MQFMRSIFNRSLAVPPLLALFLAMGSSHCALANLVFESTVDIGGLSADLQPVLTLHSNGTESGCVWWNGSSSQTGSPCPGGITGEGSGSTYRIGDSANLATNGASALGVIFKGSEPGGHPDLTIEQLILTFYDPNGAVLASASLPSPFYIPEAKSSAFLFGMDSDQAAAVQAAAFTGVGFENNRIGLAAQINGSGGAPDSFYLDVGSHFNADPAEAPEPAPLVTVGAGLLGIGLVLRRRLAKGL